MVVCVWENELPGDAPDSIICPSIQEANTLVELIKSDCGQVAKIYKLVEVSA